MQNTATYYISFFLFFIHFCSTQLFSEELSVPSEDRDVTKSIHEEIRWLQAESFLMEVTSVSKKPEKLSDSAAAVFVITQEDIRRSGATHIPDLLRMVPGLQVAQMDASKWVVTSRGFGDRFANKLLVLIDGRSVYTPLFSGTYWDVQNYLLADVERIEVIRGPGSTLWGANAVNGVINIITKDSRDTQGGLLTGRAGDEERVGGGFRYGGKIGKDAYYRLYSRGFKHDDSGNIEDSDTNGNDKWRMAQGGMRIDWGISSDDSLMFQGNLYEGDANDMVIGSSQPRRNTERSGGHVLGRWKHIFSDTSEATFQMYFDQTYRKTAISREVRNTSDFDFQHRFSLGDRQEFIWGMGYRYVTDDIVGFRSLTYDTDGSSMTDSRYDNLLNMFVQDEITLIDDKLRLILGSKVSHNDYSGLEIQPNLRLIWRPAERHSVWAAVSRSVRTPNRFEHDTVNNVTTFSTGPVSTRTNRVVGSHHFDSENLIAYELGYRFQPTKRLSIDIATFYNVYDDLRTTEDAPSFVNPANSTNTIFPVIFDNRMDGETFGLEILTDWNVTDSWKLTAEYTFLQMQLHLDNTSTDIGNDIPGVWKDVFTEGQSPQNQGSLRSYLNLPYNLEFDTSLYYVDHLSSYKIPSYLRLDARLGWQPTESLDMSVGMKNILDKEHLEFGSTDTLSTSEIERSVYFKVDWHF
ncbi:MAG: TonB-dependent receptor [Candidatus Scalindua sp.]|nr:TonB-dependent receptor [Candidatus Scalindua sp.]